MGEEFTRTDTVSFVIHPFAPVPVTMYCVFANGVATGFAIVLLERPVAGDHE